MDLTQRQKPQRNIFSVLSNDARLSLLILLNDDEAKISQLARNLNMTIPSLKKHLLIMIEDGLVERNAKNCISITPLGQSILKQVPTYQFLFENKKYFQSHSISYLPMKFIQQIGALRNSEIITGVVTCIEKWRDVVDKTQCFAKMIVAQVALDIYKEGMSKLKQNGVQMYYIFGKNTIVPKGWKMLSRKLEHDLISQGKLQRRMINKVHLMMFLSENHGCLMFPDRHGVVDVDRMFVSRDEHFLEWCDDLFNYLWNSSQPFAESKVQER